MATTDPGLSAVLDEGMDTPHEGSSRNLLAEDGISLVAMDGSSVLRRARDERLGALDEGSAADILIEIQKSPRHKVALAESIRKAGKAESRIKDMTKSCEKMKTIIFQVVGFYLVFQGVLIPVVAQSNFLQINNIWIPLSLSSAAAISCFIPVYQKGMAIAYFRGDLHEEIEALQRAVHTETELRRLGTTFSFVKHPRMTEKRSTFAYFRPYILILLFIVCFTLLILISQWRILAYKHAP